MSRAYPLFEVLSLSAWHSQQGKGITTLNVEDYKDGFEDPKDWAAFIIMQISHVYFNISLFDISRNLPHFDEKSNLSISLIGV